MKSQILIRRYAQGFVQAVLDEAEFNELQAELADFAGMLSNLEDLKDSLSSPLLPVNVKKEIVREVVASTSLKSKAARFIILLLKHNRLGRLAEILAVMPEIWNERCGVATYEVSSVAPLDDDQKKALAAKLEKLEKRPVHLEYGIDPGLVGGFSLKKGHVVYDLSLRNHLLRLRDTMTEG